ncbi:hypothetical protein GCM10009037_28100 [Halarchaeum grantii]|uniref:Uncharacterized protein n=1 Tax=Halarchaeum grantii TaxID=1193105 RepID=A0A830F5J5_9EURY|nr:hypothetical protein [Halarchaeum grantii]GGL42978.1 hypothetical protein GCM10009037_28100 [Halarchaeum grantii]
MTRRDEPVAFEADGDRLDVHDTVMDATCTFTASGPLDPVRVSTDRFLFPVDAAVSVETDELTLPAHAGLRVRSEAGDVVASVPGERKSFTRGVYYIEVSLGCKLYLKMFDAAFTLRGEPTDGPTPTTVEFEETARVAVGARSLHERPAATITMPDEPSALREALPYLASGIKEWSCERSWPTLRGHPPRLERGDALAIPDALSRPETGVTIAVPETYAALYTVAPLAYYLGADIVPATDPELRLDNGYTEAFAQHGESLGEATRALLRHCFFLDSLVRVGGYYTMERQEYEAVAGDLPFYPPNLYEASIPEQLMEYLEVKAELLSPYLPMHQYEATLRAAPTDVELLPFLLDDFVPVRVSGARRASASDALYSAYSTDPVPEGATKLSVAGFEHGLDAPPRSVESERIALLGVGGDVMDALAAVFIDHDDGSSYEAATIDRAKPTVAAVEDALSSDYDFVHVEAPITADGIECVDGVLDPATLDNVSAGIASVVGPLSEAGTALDALVERGATMGVASESITSRALGHVLGRLLSGAPFAQSVVWADHDGAYRFAGDVVACPIVREDGSTLPEYVLRSTAPDSHRVWVGAWSGFGGDSGTAVGLVSEHVVQPQRLAGTLLEQPASLSSEEVADLIEERDSVYVLNGETIQHDHALTPADVRDSARRALDDGEAGVRSGSETTDREA